jgi:hypothetical protein
MARRPYRCSNCKRITRGSWPSKKLCSACAEFNRRTGKTRPTVITCMDCGTRLGFFVGRKRCDECGWQQKLKLKYAREAKRCREHPPKPREMKCAYCGQAYLSRPFRDNIVLTSYWKFCSDVCRWRYRRKHHLERERKRARDWARAHPESRRKWGAENRDKVRAINMRHWDKANPWTPVNRELRAIRRALT